MPLAYNTKVIVSGRHIEVYQYENPVWRGYEPKENKNKEAKILSPKEQEEEDARKIQFSVRRAKTEIRRGINANPQLNKFLTLTFADNLSDLSVTNPMFNKFIKRITYRYKDFQYLVVPEFQKRGAVHYHLLCNLPFIDVKELAKIWGHGFIRLNRIDNVQNVGAYISKYLSKELFNEKLAGKKKYFRSSKLKKPTEFVGELAVKYAQKLEEQMTPEFEKEFISDYVGKVKYRVYKVYLTQPKVGLENH